MNTEVYFTTIAIVATLMFLSVIFAPVYFAIYLSIKDRQAKSAIEFMSKVQEMQKESKLDEAIERIFEEGVTE